MSALFAYGTLRRAAWRRAVLGGEYPATPATLAGWRRVALASGYLSVRREPDARVAGILLTLDERGRRRADAWEDVPRYVAVPVVVRTARGDEAAEVYVCDEPCARDDVPEVRDALLDDAAVERAIAAFALSAP